MVTRAAFVLALAACHGHVRHASPPLAGDDISLYRDLALVRQRVDFDLPATPTTVTLKAAAGLTGEQVVVLDRGGTAVTGVHVQASAATPAPKKPEDDELKIEAECNSPDGCAEESGQPDTSNDDAEPAQGPAAPTTIALDVTAPHAGHYAVTLAYVTDRLHWDAAYTMTTTPAREAAVLHGAIAVRNATGIAFPNATLHVIDAELGNWRARTAEHLATAFVGGTPSSTPAATPRDVGTATIGEGETRVELAGISAPRRMRAVLVYDPIGTKLDNTIPGPVRDATLGVTPAATSRITESFEVRRDERATTGLPAGPVRLLERRPDGTLHVLGESRLFDAATRVAAVDTIAVGTADGVTGKRERREITIDDDRRKLVEEFVITLDNTRDAKVDVLIREHLYRGQNWGIAWWSVKEAVKEGAQQFAMRTDVPAKGQAKIMYVVVYTWGQ
jgi:hypothetical protein